MLEAEIDGGANGTVYRARHTLIDEVVALKRIRDGAFADAPERKRFIKGAKAAAKVHHPNIVPIHDVREHEGELYFTMKLMLGGTLAAAAKRYAAPDRAASLVRTLALAVHEGHLRGIIHRDLKPANILFDEKDEPAIADFGIAKLLDAKDSTSTGSFMGTLGYMAPEQCGDAKEAKEAADVWALGVILYELIAGRAPFEATTPAEVLHNTLYDEPEPLDRVRRDVRRDLATVCIRCLCKLPQERYISAKALADDLDRYLSFDRITAVRPGRLMGARRWCSRHPTVALLIAAAAVSLITLTIWAIGSAHTQQRARRDEVLASNRFAARAVAGTVLHQLDEYAGWVVKEAREPPLAAALSRGDDEAVQALSGTILARHDGIVYWFVVDASGRLRAHVPPPPNARAYQRNYSFRDYFHGGMDLPQAADRPVYVSRALRATTDSLYKIAISSPIFDEGGTALGLLVAEVATDGHLGALELSDDHRITVLTVRHDREEPSESLPDDHILLVHNGVEHGEGVALQNKALDRLTARRDRAGATWRDQLRLPPPEWVESDDNYQDPLGKRGPHGAKGPWLAGIAAVGHTELSVIVQTRLDDATAPDTGTWSVLVAWSVGGAALLLASVFVAVRSKRRRFARG